jgi:hypothetical protein
MKNPDVKSGFFLFSRQVAEPQNVIIYYTFKFVPSSLCGYTLFKFFVKSQSFSTMFLLI